MAYELCPECGESFFEYYCGCFCALEEARAEYQRGLEEGKLKGIQELLHIINGKPSECKTCDNEIWFVLKPSKGPTKRWLVLNGNGTPHVCDLTF